MVMNFYKEQDHTRRQAKIMIILFLLFSLFLTIILVKAIDWTFDLSISAFFTISILFFSSICAISFYKLKELSNGNYSAIITSGVLLTESNNIRAEQLRNTVEEMAISAGIPVPKIYVLENEPSVNAFAAGLKPVDMVVGITRGSLEYLNRDELQGVAAYQMAQIINGYARLNTLIYGVLFGLECIYIVFREIYTNAYSERNEMDARLLVVFFIILFLFPIWFISYLGYFFARIIKSIICRNNVFQIDAKAVQLTRYPNGLASVLQKSLQTKWSYILFADTFLLDLEHLLLTFGKNPIYEFQILHTHPNTQERIKKMLPHWYGGSIATEDETPRPSQDTPFYNQTKVQNVLGSRKNSAKNAAEDEIKIIPTTNQNQQMVYDTLAVAAVLGVIGNTANKGEIKDEDYWLSAARQPEMASAVVVAMLSRHSDNKKACLDIAELFNKELHNNIKNLLEHALPDERRFAVLAIALPNLRLNIIGEENINKYKQFLQQVIKSDDKITLFEHCVYAAVSGCLKTSLMAGFLSPIPKDKLKTEIIELLSLTATHCNNGKNAEKSFIVACVECRLGLIEYNNAIPLGRLSSLLQKLDHLSITDKQQILTAMTNIANFDGNIAHSEKDWLSVIAIAWAM